MLERVLFFPVTPFTKDDTVNDGALALHIDAGVSAGTGGVFAACGTGEFHSLNNEEYEVVARVTVEATAGRTPVFLGAGGPVAVARQQVRIAERSGADGILLLPPYLVAGPGEGLVKYVEQVAAATDLPIVVYHRSTAQFTEESAIAVSRVPNVIGLKDGVGNVDLMARIVQAVHTAHEGSSEEFLFFNGLPTAEVAQSAYRALGVPLYSSATFAFAPDVTMAYFDALQEGDTGRVRALNSAFFHPLVRLREKVPGYAVSLVKGAVGRFCGIDVGHVRAPFIEARPEHLDELEIILAAARALPAPVAA